MPGRVVDLFITGGGLYSHQRPRGGAHFYGRYTPIERLRRRLRDYRRVGCGLEGGKLSGRLVSAISSTVGGLDWRSRAAASDRAASIVTRVSGPAYLWGLVIERLEGSPEKGLVQGCSREGEERPNPELLTLEWVAVESWLGSAWPAYKAQKIQGGPGEMRFLNSHWSLEWEAVTNERSGSCGDAPLGYSSSRGGHWPLTWVGSLSEMLNFYWSSAHPGSWGRPGGLLN